VECCFERSSTMLKQFCSAMLTTFGVIAVFAGMAASPAHAVHPLPVTCAGSCTGSSDCIGSSSDCSDNNNGKNNCTCDTGVTNRCLCT